MRVREGETARKEVKIVKQSHWLSTLMCIAITGSAPNLLASGVSSSLDAKFQSMEPMARMNLGRQISTIDRSMFAGEITVRAYEKGFIVAKKTRSDWNGNPRMEVVFLHEDNLRQKPVLGIRDFYVKQGGKKVYGTPIEGPHAIFGGSHRLHVFSKGLIFSKFVKEHDWVRAGVVFEKDFRP